MSKLRVICKCVRELEPHFPRGRSGLLRQVVFSRQVPLYQDCLLNIVSTKYVLHGSSLKLKCVLNMQIAPFVVNWSKTSQR